MELDQLTQQVMARLFIPLEASGRHVHLTEAQAQVLVGHLLTPKRPLSQPGQYLANERLTVVGPKGQFENVAVLGPERKEAQVEISLTDARTLGLTPPVRPSGKVEDSPGAVLTGPDTRSSSPLRILRDEACQSEVRGLVPCGEGAGYAGGITSAAVDGLRAAEAVSRRFAPWGE